MRPKPSIPEIIDATRAAKVTFGEEVFWEAIDWYCGFKDGCRILRAASALTKGTGKSKVMPADDVSKVMPPSLPGLPSN